MFIPAVYIEISMITLGSDYRTKSSFIRDDTIYIQRTK